MIVVTQSGISTHTLNSSTIQIGVPQETDFPILNRMFLFGLAKHALTQCIDASSNLFV